MVPPVQALAERLSGQREAFLGFLCARMGNPADAEDLLQISLVRALREADQLRDGTKLEAWFYQILRHAMLDHARSRGAARAREAAWSQLAESDELRARACACLAGVIATLKPEHARLINEVELQGARLGLAAERVGVSPGHAAVIIHRAHREIRARLELVCGDCSVQSCRECDCDV